jgi:acyl-ACP thioesterase
VRPDATIAHLRTFPEQRSIGCDPERIPDTVAGSGAAEVAVRYSDLDLNDHVNNTSYARWILDSYPVEFHRAHRVGSMSINFLAEMGGDDVAILTSQRATSLEVRHTIRRRADNAEACRARLTWSEIGP